MSGCNSSAVPCSLGHFSWEKYLKETGALAAPPSCFRQVNMLSLTFAVKLHNSVFSHLRLEPCTSNEWVQNRDEAGGPGPTEHHIYLHRHCGGLDGLPSPAQVGWVRQ